MTDMGYCGSIPPCRVILPGTGTVYPSRHGWHGFCGMCLLSHMVGIVSVVQACQVICLSQILC